MVFFSRLRRRKPIHLADLSHTYHRLVLLGMDTRKAVVLMHLAGLFLGCFAFVALSLPPLAANLIFGSILIVGAILIIFLEGVVRNKNAPAN
jgi:hypothetical protein